MMKRILFALTGVTLAICMMVIGGVDNIARGQSALAAPTNVAAANGSNSGEVLVSWNAVAGATYYRIGWMADEDYQAALAEPHGEWEKEFRYSNIVNRNGRTTSRTVTRLTPGIKYWIIVGSHDAFYGGPQWSGWQEVTLTAAPTLTPPDGGTGAVLPEPQPTNTVAFDGSRLSSVSSGKFHTCGVRQNGTIHCFGANGRNQSSPPEGEFLSVSAGGNHSCGVKADGKVACWGSSAVETPPATHTFVQVDSGDSHACGLIAWPGGEARHQVICWGAAGLSRTDEFSTSRYYPIEAISVGDNHNCALYNDDGGDVACWGSNEAGQRVFLRSGAKAVSAGGEHTCWILRNGIAECHGSDTSGQSTIPTVPEGDFDQEPYTYTELSAGGAHTCAINGDGNAKQAKGTVRCWGSDLDGQSSPPSGIFDSVSSGKSHTCALRQNGTIACWGDNSYGQAPR